MNRIEAIIRPEKLTAVMDALEAVGCIGLNVTQVTGRGRQRGVEIFTGRGAQTATVTMLPKVKIETVVSDGDTDTVVNAMIASARTGDEGAIGDGKIFISAITDVVRVSSGERGDAAI